jgi:hypothetical protein
MSQPQPDPPIHSAFGHIISGYDVQEAVKITTKRWSNDYLAEMARLSGRARGDLKPFRSYKRAITLDDKRVQDQLPCCLILSPGTLDTPIKRSKHVDARWELGFGVVIAGKDEDNAWELVQLYSAACRTMLLQKSSLGGFAIGVNWISERYDQLRSRNVRNLMAGTLHFGIDVARVSHPERGPHDPREDTTQPPEEWPTVATVEVDIEPMALGGTSE